MALTATNLWFCSLFSVAFFVLFDYVILSLGLIRLKFRQRKIIRCVCINGIRNHPFNTFNFFKNRFQNSTIDNISINETAILSSTSGGKYHRIDPKKSVEWTLRGKCGRLKSHNELLICKWRQIAMIHYHYKEFNRTTSEAICLEFGVLYLIC